VVSKRDQLVLEFTDMFLSFNATYSSRNGLLIIKQFASILSQVDDPEQESEWWWSPWRLH